MTTQKWGALAAWMLAVTSIAAPLILVTGPTQPLQLSIYDLGDFLGGPVWSASLIALILILMEKIGEKAKDRMTVALIAAALSAAAAITAAMIRTANRQYLAQHWEINEAGWHDSLVAWTTVITGITA